MSTLIICLIVWAKLREKLLTTTVLITDTPWPLETENHERRWPLSALELFTQLLFTKTS